MLLAAGCSDALYCPSMDSPLAGRTALDFALDAKDSQSKMDTVQLLREAGAVAPCSEPHSLVGARVIVDARAGAVVSCDDKVAFGLSAADRNIKYTVTFDDAFGKGEKKSESVKLVRSSGGASNGGVLYSIVGQLRGTGVSGKIIDAMASTSSAAPPAQPFQTAPSGSPAVGPVTIAVTIGDASAATAGGKSSTRVLESKEETEMRESLTAFYQVHNPEMLADQDQMQKVVR